MIHYLCSLLGASTNDLVTAEKPAGCNSDWFSTVFTGGQKKVNGENYYLTEILRYNVADKSWLSTGNMREPRRSSAVALITHYVLEQSCSPKFSGL